MTNLLIPFSIAFNTLAEGQFFLSHDLMSSIVHLLPARTNGSPSPFIHAKFIFLSLTDRNPIRLATSKVSGIYCWINQVNGKCYVGKSNSLYLRLSNYFQVGHIEAHLGSSFICRAIFKYGIQAFSLVILEVNPSNIAHAEQY